MPSGLSFPPACADILSIRNVSSKSAICIHVMRIEDLGIALAQWEYNWIKQSKNNIRYMIAVEQEFE